MDDIKQALSTAYGVFLASPSSDVWEKPDLILKKRAMDRGLTASTHQRKAQRLKYSPDRTTLVEIPAKHTVTATATRRHSQAHTAVVAKAMEAGQVIAAAENQAAIKALWLRYCYDPYLDINRNVNQQIERLLMPLMFGVWCYWPRRKTPTQRQLQRAILFFGMVVQDAARCERGGSLSLKTSSTYKAEQMGYGESRAAFQKSDYTRQWAPLEKDIRALATMLDQAAMEPVYQLFIHSSRAMQSFH